MIKKFFLDILKHHELLGILTHQYVVIRYKRTSLGYLWTLVNPIAMILVMTLVFSGLFGEDPLEFGFFVFSGMLVWNYINGVVMQASTCLIFNEGLIKKVSLPKILFPLVICIGLLIDFGMGLLVLLLAKVLTAGFTDLNRVLEILPAIAILFLFGMGVSFIAAVATVYFRDLQYVLAIAMQGLFFLTPVIYKTKMINGVASIIIDANPITPLINLFRDVLYKGVSPEFNTWAVSASVSFFIFCAGLYLFRKLEKNVVFRL